jgi:hypothetical protein
VSAPSPTLDPPADVMRSLVSGPITQIELISRGRNSRVYRVRSETMTFALKQYPPRQNDPHDRLDTEVDALRLMKRHRFDTVPDVIAVNRDRGFALLSWIDGSPVTAVSTADMDQAVAFLGAVHALRQSSGFAQRRHAAEACLSGAAIEQQIRARLKRLEELPVGEEQLHAFLQVSFKPTFDALIGQARERMCAAGLEFAGVLPQRKRSLVPSDFGFHNSLRRPTGSLAFFDFEYFGWDDPVKLVADVLLHPGTPIEQPLRQQFRRAAERLYGGDSTFLPRLDALFPLFGLRWVLIMLNEFLPSGWRRRVLAGVAGGWAEAKQLQLVRARQFLDRVTDVNQGAVHGEHVESGKPRPDRVGSAATRRAREASASPHRARS